MSGKLFSMCCAWKVQVLIEDSGWENVEWAVGKVDFVWENGGAYLVLSFDRLERLKTITLSHSATAKGTSPNACWRGTGDSRRLVYLEEKSVPRVGNPAPAASGRANLEFWVRSLDCARDDNFYTPHLRLGLCKATKGEHFKNRTITWLVGGMSV